MDRRIWSIILVALIGSAVNAPDATAGSDEISIVGDVSRPLTLRFDQTQAVSLEGILQHGQAAPGGVASVLRPADGWQKVAEFIVSAITEVSKVPVAPGDIVIYRSGNGRIADHANALVVFADGRAELPLPDGVCAVHQLLNQLQLPARPITVIRSDRAQITIVELDAVDDLRHCDVIDLTDVSIAALQPQTAFDRAPGEASDFTGDTQVGFASNGDEPATFNIPQPLITKSGSSAGSQPGGLSLPLLDAGNRSQDLPTSQPSATTDDADVFQVASLASVVASDSSSDVAAAATPENLAANALAVSTPVTDSLGGSGSIVMDTIFVAGLLFAMGLILVGWARMKREQELEQQINNSLKDSISTADSPSSEGSIPQSIPLAASTQSEQYLVDEATADHEDNLIDRGADWFSGAEESAAEVSAEKTESAERQEPVSAQMSAAPIQPTESVELLDDLIENRLPSRLVDADLPLRISLFGRPQGPQRLRIDGAHQQIAPPHMLKRSRSTASAKPKAAVVPSAKSDDSADSQIDFSRLDRALNSLKEQADS